MISASRSASAFTVAPAVWPVGLDEVRRSAFSRRSGFRRLNGSLTAAVRADEGVATWDASVDVHGLHLLVANTLEQVWLRTCIACAEAGCHLWLHQSHLFERCPWHDLPLTLSCMHCGLPFMQRLGGRRPVDACARCRRSALPDPCSWAPLPAEDPLRAASDRWTGRVTSWVTHPRYGTHRSVQATSPELLGSMLAAYERVCASDLRSGPLAHARQVCVAPEGAVDPSAETVDAFEWWAHVRAIGRAWRRQCPYPARAADRARLRVALEDWRARHLPCSKEAEVGLPTASPNSVPDRAALRLALHALWIDGWMSWRDARSVYWRRAHVRWSHLRVGEVDGSAWHVMSFSEPSADDCASASMVHVP